LKSQTPGQVDEWDAQTVPETSVFGDEPFSLPAPRTLGDDLMMDEGQDEEAYVRAFLSEFDAAGADSVVYEDKAGDALAISDELFRRRDGSYKVMKRGRAPHVRYLARTIQEPDEIWARLEKIGDRWRLARRYVARWHTDSMNEPLLAAFEWRGDAWRRGLTTFKADSERYLDNQRTGIRLYRRREENP
jgi:hypothetical protein